MCIFTLIFLQVIAFFTAIFFDKKGDWFIEIKLLDSLKILYSLYITIVINSIPIYNRLLSNHLSKQLHQTENIYRL